MLHHLGGDFVAESRFHDAERRLPRAESRHPRLPRQVLRDMRDLCVNDFGRYLYVDVLLALTDVY
jgi:hypothetical protein